MNWCEDCVAVAVWECGRDSGLRGGRVGMEV